MMTRLKGSGKSRREFCRSVNTEERLQAMPQLLWLRNKHWIEPALRAIGGDLE